MPLWSNVYSSEWSVGQEAQMNYDWGDNNIDAVRKTRPEYGTVCPFLFLLSVQTETDRDREREKRETWRGGAESWTAAMLLAAEISQWTPPLVVGSLPITACTTSELTKGSNLRRGNSPAEFLPTAFRESLRKLSVETLFFSPTLSGIRVDYREKENTGR